MLLKPMEPVITTQMSFLFEIELLIDLQTRNMAYNVI